MPRLKNPNHEKFSREYAKELAKPEGKVVTSKVYKQVYAVQQHTAETNGPELLRKPEIQSRIQEIITGLNPPEALSQDLADLRKATKQVFDPEGNLIEVKDNQTRIAAVNTVLKAVGAFQDNQTNIDARSINYTVQNGSNDKLEAILSRLESMNRKLLDS